MAISQELIGRAPGLLGRITSFINETSLYSQPQLALAAAISCIASLKAHKVKSDTDLRTNFLIVGLANSGDGKGHGLKIVEKLLEATGHDFLLSGRPASDVGLLKSLSKTGKKIVLWDEFGIHLSAMTSPRAQAYKANILSILMDTFSAADGLYRGFEYADNDGKRPRIDIQEPCLNLYGVSTPVRYYESLNSAFVIDGFIPRVLTFISEDKELATPLPADFFKKVKLDETLIEEIKEAFPVGVLSHLAVDRVPELVTFKTSNHAMTVMTKMLHKYHNLKTSAQSEPERAVYSRAVEHFIKLCLVAEDVGNPCINGAVAVWCAEVINALVPDTINILKDKIFDSTFQKESSKLITVIKKAGGQISKSELCRKTQYMSPKDREAILDSLMQTETMEHLWLEANEHSQKKKRTLYYKLK